MDEIDRWGWEMFEKQRIKRGPRIDSNIPCRVCGHESAPIELVIEEPGEPDDHIRVCRECASFLIGLKKRELS